MEGTSITEQFPGTRASADLGQERHFRTREFKVQMRDQRVWWIKWGTFREDMQISESTTTEKPGK